VGREVGAGNFGVEAGVAAADGEAFEELAEEGEALVILHLHAADFDRAGAVVGGDELVVLEFVVAGVAEFLRR
jgi:hypothetical protein